jgi:[acyl-carrier-protein] S-malonyltransferase
MKALLFPGQGSQFVGMGQNLYASFAAARRVFDEADATLGFPLTRLMFDGPEEALRETRNAQPAILTHSAAVWEVLRPVLGRVRWVAAGHSLGEYSAYVAAESFRFADAVRVVRRRGELMYAAGRASPGTMAAVLGCELEVIEEICAQTPGMVVAANINSPGQIVISGERAAVEAASAALRARNVRKVVELSVSGAFHSPLMAPAAEGLREVLTGVGVAEARCPVYANASAEPVLEADTIRASLTQQLLSPVRWDATMRRMIGLGATEFYEIGPGQVLKGLLRSIDRNLPCRSLGTAEDVQAFLEEQMAGREEKPAAETGAGGMSVAQPGGQEHGELRG